MDNQIWAYKKLYTQFRMRVCTLKPAEELALNAEQLSFKESIVITNVERGRCLMIYSRRTILLWVAEPQKLKSQRTLEN